MVTVYHLICEGPCNPDIKILDATIARETSASKAVTPSPGALAWTKEMRYTRHLASSRKDHVFCTVCNHERRYGNSVKYTPYYLTETHDTHDAADDDASEENS